MLTVPASPCPCWGQFKKSFKDYNADIPHQAYYIKNYEMKEGKKFKYCNKTAHCPKLSTYHLCIKMKDLLWPDDWCKLGDIMTMAEETHASPTKESLLSKNLRAADLLIRH